MTARTNRIGFGIERPFPLLRITRIGDEKGEAHRLASEQDAGLGGDLREHGRADRALVPRPTDEIAELLEPRALMGNPVLHRRIRLLAAKACQEIDPELLEVTLEAGGKQPLPLIRRHEACELLLRPVDP